MPNEINVDEKFARLEDALRRDNAENVQEAMFDLGAIRNDWSEIPDEVVDSASN